MRDFEKDIFNSKFVTKVIRNWHGMKKKESDKNFETADLKTCFPDD